MPLIDEAGLEEFEDALSELEDEIGYADDVDYINTALDVVASALSIATGKDIGSGSASDLFEQFVEHGLDSEVPTHCEEIEAIASETTYDDDADMEDRIWDAEVLREKIHTAFLKFVEVLREAVGGK